MSKPWIGNKALAGLLAAMGMATGGAHAADGFDAEREWRGFLESRDAVDAYDAYEVLERVDYDNHAVDEAACRDHADELAEAVRKAPVSIALRHAALLCADATGDRALAAREGAAFEGLASHALARSTELSAAAPIPVPGLRDAYVLVAAIGLEPTYAYYTRASPTRYMPYAIVAWDEEAQEERHLTFDTMNVMNAVIHDDPYSGFPYQRAQIVTAILEGQVENDVLMARDIAAVHDSTQTGDPVEKVKRLAVAANDGGIQSLATWMTICEITAYEGCTDGLVDALLPVAEQRQAIPMVFLAYAYAQGLGIERDESAAAALLDAADRRWPRAGGSAYFVAYWSARHKAPVPPLVQSRTDIARAAGNPNIEDTVLAHRLAGDNPSLAAAEIEHLQRPALNVHGAGYAMLHGYYRQIEDEATATTWLKRAADAGDADAAAAWGARLQFGEGMPADPEAARGFLELAADAGSAIAGRMLSHEAGQAGKWDEAMAWLLLPTYNGDADAYLDVARIYEHERPGFTGQQARAVELYESFAGHPQGMEARRRLAMMALHGNGMAKSPERAVSLLRQDAERGDTQSQVLLGAGYLHGEFGEADEALGRKWLEQAMEAGAFDAFSSYGLWLANHGEDAEKRGEGLRVLERGAELEDNAVGLNNLAWVLCTSPHDDVREPVRGLEVSRRMGDPEALNEGFRDTVAACHAATGDFDDAVALQQSALAGFRDYAESGGTYIREQMAETLERADARLALYKAGKPYLEVDPE